MAKARPAPDVFPFRKLAKRILRAQEAERRRISNELHDDLGQRLALLSIQIEQLEQKALSPAVADGLESLRRQVSEISDDVHRICYHLHPVVLENVGLGVALESFCKEYAEHSGVSTRFVRENVPARLPSDVSLCAYRIVQEALNNVSKHADALDVSVIVRGVCDDLEVIIEDSGQGFDRAAVLRKSGLGLISIEERARLAGGHCSIRSSPPRFGTEVRAVLPLRHSA